MLFLRRLLPMVVGAAVYGALAWQAQSPGAYPWFALATVGVFAAASWWLAGGRVPFMDLLARMGGPALLLCAIGAALVLAEGALADLILPLTAGMASYAALELLFLHAFLPARYPVNGLSHLSLALVPLTIWCAQYTAVGLMMFIHTPRWVPMAVMVPVVAALFWTTAHAEADRAHRLRWTLIGAAIGMHIGILGALLPIDIVLHGVYAAVLGALGLRVRRYGIAPRLSRRLMWTETVGAAVLLLTLFATGRWA